MKTKKIITLGVILIAFSACTLTGESNSTPSIQLVRNPVNTKGDSLSIFYTDTINTYRMDTIHVGDTLNFKVYINAFANNIKGYYMTQSDSTAKVLLPRKSAMDSLFSTNSNYNQGIFLLKKPLTTLYFPFQYVAKKPSMNTKLSLKVLSDANFEFNQASFILITPIVTRK